MRIGLAALLGLVLVGCDTPVEEQSDVGEVTCPSACPDNECQSDGSCALERCDADGRCGAGSFCDATIGYCRSGCEAGDLCADGTVCSPDQSCVACEPGVGVVCPVNAGACIDGRCIACVEDSDCGLGTGRICASANNQCIEGCKTNENCPTEEVCDSSNAECVECFLDSHCGSGMCDEEQATCQ